MAPRIESPSRIEPTPLRVVSRLTPLADLQDPPALPSMPSIALLGFESLEHITAAGPGHSAEAMIEHVVGAVRTFQGEVEQIDDTTVVAVRVKKGTVYAA